MNRIKNLINRWWYYLPVKTFRYYNLSFSQDGEDRILYRIFENKKSGFYVDIGAHHPQRFSNTYLFYLKGWRGINIDAMPGSMDAFNKIRPFDTNIESGVGLHEKKRNSIYLTNLLITHLAGKKLLL